MAKTHELLTPGPRFNYDISYTIRSAKFDVDNTLVPNESPDLPTSRFTTAAWEAGVIIPLALASARQLQKTEHVIKHASLKGISILMNGAQLFDGKTGEMLFERPLSVQTTIKIARDLQALGMNHWVQDNGVDHTWSGNNVTSADNVESNGLGLYTRPKDIWQPKKDPIEVPIYTPRKPFVIAVNDVLPSDRDHVLQLANGYSNQGVTSIVAHERHTDEGIRYQMFILDKRANKREALQTAGEIEGIPLEETMAVGDGPNDTVIVESAGIGVAVANAVDATKAVATFLAPSREDDGAAVALEQLVLRKYRQ